MMFRLNDRFLVEGVETKVVYINHGCAWVAPVNDGDFFNGEPLFVGLVFAKLNEQGRVQSTGKKALPIVNPPSPIV